MLLYSISNIQEINAINLLFLYFFSAIFQQVTITKFLPEKQHSNNRQKHLIYKPITSNQQGANSNRLNENEIFNKLLRSPKNYRKLFR
jgi:hypothetical protein